MKLRKVMLRMAVEDNKGEAEEDEKEKQVCHGDCRRALRDFVSLRPLVLNPVSRDGCVLSAVADASKDRMGALVLLADMKDGVKDDNLTVQKAWGTRCRGG